MKNQLLRIKTDLLGRDELKVLNGGGNRPKVEFGINSHFNEQEVFIFLRNAGYRTTTDNVHCGRRQHTVTMDIVAPSTDDATVNLIYTIATGLDAIFRSWVLDPTQKVTIGGEEQELFSEGFELASAFLESSGTYSLPGGGGVGLDCSFLVDQRMG